MYPASSLERLLLVLWPLCTFAHFRLIDSTDSKNKVSVCFLEYQSDRLSPQLRSFHRRSNCASSTNKRCVTITPLADPEHPVLAPGGVLPGCQSQIGGEFPAVVKRLGISEFHAENRPAQGSDTRNGHQTLAIGARLRPGPDRSIKIQNSRLQLGEFLKKFPYSQPHRR